MPFIPATPGIVGFGGGEKPAVFQAIAPQYSLMNQQTDDEDEPPITFCHDFIGDNLDVLNTGITICGGCYTDPVSGRDFSLSFTGVNGGFTLIWDGVSSWVLVVGVLTVVTYMSGDGTCSVVDTTFTYDVTQIVICAGSNLFDTSIGSSAQVGGFPVNFGLFQDAAPQTFDAPMSNALLLAGCGGISGGNGQSAYDGSVTVPTP